MNDLKDMDDSTLYRLLDNNEYLRQQMAKRDGKQFQELAREAELRIDALLEEVMRRRPGLRELLMRPREA